jgi:hypothetical protein
MSVLDRLDTSGSGQLMTDDGPVSMERRTDFLRYFYGEPKREKRDRCERSDARRKYPTPSLRGALQSHLET